MKVAQSRKTGPVGGNQGAGVFLLITTSLIKVRTPPVTGALGVIGLSGRARQKIKVKTGERAMKLKTRVFGLSNGKYRNLTELVQAMGVSYDLFYRVRRGERGIHERFIIGATRAFPGYKLDDLFYVSED